MIQDEHILFEGHSSVVLTANISVDNKFLFTSSNDGTCKIWDIASQNELMTLVLIDSADYIVKTPSGLFDATPGAMEKMYWVKGLDVIEFNQLKDRYWEPGLWEKVMKGEQLRDVRGMNEIKLQPEVELADITDGKLPIHLIRRDGGYGRVVVMINGKEVEADARGNGFDTTKTQQTILYNLKDNPLLQPGKENTITVKTWSADGFVEGRGTVITYIPAGDSASLPPSLFAVVLGVSDYSSNSIHLKYAQPDAAAMSTAIRLGGENLFGREHTFVYSLTSPGDIKPTKENIQKVFAEIKTKAKPNDILMLYMSGHGITWGGDRGDFYYLTADAYSSSAEAYNDPAIRAKSTISTQEFTEWIKEIPALKQVMIIDACGSGKAVDNLLAQRDVDASQIKAIDRMKDRTGMFIISGCAADAVSYEASRYGQGLLTYTILQAMKGAALKEDKYVDVNTLLNYAREQVPLLAAGVGGLQQPQLLIPKGGSFDIGLLDENARKQIVLASPKPVFVRSTFLDADQLEDIISLAKSVDEALGGLSFKGNDSPIIFVDTRDYPDGCKISGTYLQKDGLFTLNGKIKCGSIETPLKLSGISKEKLVEEIINIVNKL